MNKTLNSLFVRLDTKMQNLSEIAIGQIIVKILYGHTGSMSKEDISNELKKLNGDKGFDSDKITNVLDLLCQKEIQVHHGMYSISKSKRDNIKKKENEANERNIRIIEKYFSRLNTDKTIIQDWLQDATVKFFQSFSEEWISDLKAGTSYITSSEKSIRDMIERWTGTLKNIHKDDKVELPNRFYTFIKSSSSDVDSYLWEFGTSAFSARLIRTMHGIDDITIDTFRNSHCVLDTNILMFIALESRYKDSFKAIERVFRDLNVSAEILYITKSEYERKINSQKSLTLNNLEEIGCELALLPNDDFTAYAKKLGCKTKADFERYFDETLALPKYIHEQVSIKLLDDSINLNNIIESAKNEQTECAKLNGMYKIIVGHEKSSSALAHDIGLLHGVNYLRNQRETTNDKYFILSEEISVNQYSKKSGFVNNLPLSMRVSTLINLLAINNGGDTFDATDYSSLFANIIRYRLEPPKDLFKQSELYEYYQMNAKIANLPPDRSAQILMDIHREMLDGKSKEQIRRDLDEKIIDGELDMRTDLDNTKDELKSINNKYQRNLLEIDKMKKVFIRQETEKYDKKTKKLKRTYYIYLPLFILLLTIIAVVIINKYYYFNIMKYWVIPIFINIVTDFIIEYRCAVPKINQRKKDRDEAIAEEVAKKLV